jgi:hypothetical protein
MLPLFFCIAVADPAITNMTCPLPPFIEYHEKRRKSVLIEDYMS